MRTPSPPCSFLRAAARRIGCALAALALAVVLVLAVEPARAEPRLSMLTGQGCASCHVNATGGGLPTRAGFDYAHDELPSWVPEVRYDPWIGPQVQLGGAVEVRDTATLPAHTTLGTGQWEAAGGNALALKTANLRFRLDPVPDKLTLYIDEVIGLEGAEVREAFAMASGLPGGLYLKAGRIWMPYGLRLPDDTAFVREQTGFSSTRREVGVEAGMLQGPLALAVALASRSPIEQAAFDARRLSATASLTTRWVLAGASFAFDDTRDPRFPYKTLLGGAHLGARAGPLIGLVEADLLHGWTTREDVGQAALYFELDGRITRGVWLQGTFEAFDPLRGEAENERDRFGFAATFYPLPQLSLEAAYELNRDIPQRPQGNADVLRIGVRGFL